MTNEKEKIPSAVGADKFKHTAAAPKNRVVLEDQKPAPPNHRGHEREFMADQKL
jgi:hypothetical protein